MDYQYIELEKKDHIATITLNRPEKLNSLSAGLLTEFGGALDDIQDDHDINVLIVTGAGGPSHRGSTYPRARPTRTGLPRPAGMRRIWHLGR